jgi:large subunit ribosomal protein L7/L12
MGFLRKTLLIGTGGLAPVKASSKKERTAKAAEAQLKVQRKMLREQQAANTTAARAVAVPSALDRAITVNLEAAGNRPVGVMKIVREATGLSLKEVKALVDNAPSAFAYGPTPDAAWRLRDQLVAAGARAEVTGIDTSPGQGTNLTDELERLAGLHERGLLTDAEFVAAKGRVLTNG